MLKKLHAHLVKRIGKYNAKHVTKKVKQSAARHTVIEIHAAFDHVRRHERAALSKLRNVGRHVAEQITKEDLAAHKSRKVSVHQGELAGKAAIKFAAVLVQKELSKHLGAKTTKALLKRVIAKANLHAKHSAQK